MESSDVLIALVGVTGAGKTTFASIASDRKDLLIGHGADPCTQDPMAVPFRLDGREVVLIDTPGFDDDERSDVEILEDIGRWLMRQGYAKGHQLNGLILLHPITHQRAGGMERKRTRLLQKILGIDAYRRIVIATTMWDGFMFSDRLDGRVQTRTSEGGVWADMVAGGAKVLRHDNNKASAHNIIRHIINISDKAGKIRPLLQEDLEKSHGRVEETSAGRELKYQLEEDVDFIMSQISDHRQERPPESWRKSSDVQERRKWREWEAERQDLMKKLERRQTQLRKLSSLVVRARHLFSRLFGKS